MCCSLQYKEGPRTIEINGFNTVNEAVKHAKENYINEFLLKVEDN